MNSDTHDHINATGEHKKRKVFDTPTVDRNGDVKHSQLLYPSPIKNLQQPSSASDYINGGADVNHSDRSLFLFASPIGNLQQQPSSASNYVNDRPVRCCPCVHKCQCGCHETITMVGMKAGTEVTVEGDILDSLPVGYRFVPTDEELFGYLLKKINNEKIPKTKISEACIYGDHPKDLVVKYPEATQECWYFFTPRSRKYPNGGRPDRHAGSGYWKATGPDKVYKDNNGVKIGGRKSLVYFEGHAPHWIKTKWMMHEYVIEGHSTNRLNSKNKEFNDYVLCKIYINGRMKEEVATDHQQSRAANNVDGNITNGILVENEQALVPNQLAHLLLQANQDSKNVVVQQQHDLDHVIDPTIVETENGVMVPDQHTCVVSNDQEVNPLRFWSGSSASVEILESKPHTDLLSHALNEHLHPLRFWSGSSNNQQVASGFQERGDGDPAAKSLRENIELMYALDGYDGFIDDDDQFQYDCLDENMESKENI